MCGWDGMWVGWCVGGMVCGWDGVWVGCERNSVQVKVVGMVCGYGWDDVCEMVCGWDGVWVGWCVGGMVCGWDVRGIVCK